MENYCWCGQVSKSVEREGRERGREKRERNGGEKSEGDDRRREKERDLSVRQNMQLFKITTYRFPILFIACVTIFLPAHGQNWLINSGDFPTREPIKMFRAYIWAFNGEQWLQ